MATKQGWFSCFLLLVSALTLDAQGPRPIPVIYPGMEELKAIDYAVTFISEGAPSKYKQSLLKYVNGTVLYASTVEYTFTLDTSGTTCLKTNPSTNCPLKEPKDKNNPDWNECSLKILQTKTPNKYVASNLVCQRPNNRLRK